MSVVAASAGSDRQQQYGGADSETHDFPLQLAVKRRKIQAP
jgi:hypothetical protein